MSNDSGASGQGPLGYIAEALRPLAVPIDTLNPDPANARTHNEKNLSAIAASLSRFGQRAPIVVQRQGMVVRAGNGRLLAARQLGWQSIAAVIVDESSVDATAFAIADNRTAELAGWDDDTLASLLQSLPEDMRDVAGFDEGDLKEVLDRLTPEVVEDEAPEPLPAPVSARGDLWVMGEHRLVCGDCTILDDVERVTCGRCDVCLTDPPYGCGEAYVSHNDTQAALGTLAERFFPIARDRCEVVAFTPGIQNIRHYPSCDWMLCWFYGVGTGRTPWGFTCWQPVCVWGKDPQLANGMGCHPDGVNKLMSKDDAEQNRSTGHACPKPLSVWCWFLERVTAGTGTTVYEPFSGSGTTIIACEQLKRKCYAIEIEPRYVDVAVRRWEKLTGQKAILDGTNKTWAEVARDRGVSIDQ